MRTPSTQYVIKFTNWLQYGPLAYYHFACYSNGRVAIALTDMDGAPLCTASVNLVEEDIAPHALFMKETDGLEGLPNEFVENGILEPTGRHAISGFNKYRLYNLTAEGLLQLIQTIKSASE